MMGCTSSISRNQTTRRKLLRLQTNCGMIVYTKCENGGVQVPLYFFLGAFFSVAIKYYPVQFYLTGGALGGAKSSEVRTTDSPIRR